MRQVAQSSLGSRKRWILLDALECVAPQLCQQLANLGRCRGGFLLFLDHHSFSRVTAHTFSLATTILRH